MEQIAVFLDYSNVHLLAHDMYAPNLERWTTHLSPRLIADRIVELRGRDSELGRVHFYRGSPDFHRDIEATRVFREESARWERDSKTTAHYEPMLYGWGRTVPKESGVDMRLGLDLVEAARSHAYDRIVLFSGDSDLLPAVEDVVKTTSRLELVAWTDGQATPGNVLTERCRRKGFRLWTHHFDSEDFWACQDRALRPAA